jgi:hypothetical protein
MVGLILDALVSAFMLARQEKRRTNRPALALSPAYYQGKTLVVRILPKAVENPHSWFRNHPGEAFEVTPIRGGYMLAQDIGPVIRCIWADDCEVVRGKVA